jgi:hypothetical protein
VPFKGEGNEETDRRHVIVVVVVVVVVLHYVNWNIMKKMFQFFVGYYNFV